MKLSLSLFLCGVIAGTVASNGQDTWEQKSPPSTPINRNRASAVWTGTKMIIWGGAGSNQNDGGQYDPWANIWTPTTTNGAPAARFDHTTVWTGKEMIVWGGDPGQGPLLFGDGGRYNPSSNAWFLISSNGAPTGRRFHTAVWTGIEMIIWGGGYNDGGRYNPISNTWIMMSLTNAPATRYQHSAVWTGTEMIIWGGFTNAAFPSLNDGGRYDPLTDTWKPLSMTNAPASRIQHTGVWTGHEMIIAGGRSGMNIFTLNTDSARYDPLTDTWTALPTNGAPAGRWRHVGLWTGHELIVWGGVGNNSLNNGGRYDPQANAWTAMITNGAPARYWPAAVWTGTEMIVWGGGGDSNPTNTWLYRPSPPHLSVAGDRNQLVLSWPYPSIGFSAESKSTVDGTNWISVPGSPTNTGSQLQVTIDSPAQSFYRLRKP